MNEYVVPTMILAADHAGYEMKEYVRDYLQSRDPQPMIVDHGAGSFNPQDDYPDIMANASEALQKSINEGSHVMGIFFGGSGYGEAIVANRFAGIRAVPWYGTHAMSNQIESEGTPGADGYDILRITRKHNNANVLSIGVRFIENNEDAIRAINIFLSTPFDQNVERHVRRIEKIDTLTS